MLPRLQHPIFKKYIVLPKLALRKIHLLLVAKYWVCLLKMVLVAIGPTMVTKLIGLCDVSVWINLSASVYM